MKSNIRKLLILPILALGLTACSSTKTIVYYEGYYSPIYTTEIGPSLLHSLHQLMISTHNYYPTYSSFTNYIKSPDDQNRTLQCDSEDNTKVVLFYTGGMMARKSYTNTSREHVWACANSSGLWTHNSGDGEHYVDSGSYRGGGSDLHHVRLADYDVNTGRLNWRFGEITEGSYTEYKDSCEGPYVLKVSTGIAEPADEYKGDIARILMYVYMHYNSILGDDVAGKNYCSTLNLTSVVVCNNLEDGQKLLCRWNAEDPVDDNERLSNEFVYGKQGNRNPFIDHEDFMARCFDFETEDFMPSTSTSEAA